MNPRCYLCGAPDPETRDHIPPKGFFPDPKPANLITVPCCAKCNAAYAKDDEAFRAWIVMADQISQAGQWIFDQRVIPHTIQRSPKLAQHIRDSIKTVSQNGRTVDLIAFPQDRARKFLIRITKGLLAYNYPEIDQRVLAFEAGHLVLTEHNRAAYEEIRNSSIYDSRGDNVFQFRRFVIEKTGQGIWLYCFYGASIFSARHKPLASD